MMLISDLVVKARRILGDTNKQRWSDERMLDIVNSGLRDINKFAGVYRSEHFFELLNFTSRYPLPTDLLSITSVWHDKNLIPIYGREEQTHNMFVTKDQINIGVLEVINSPVVPERNRRFVAGPTDSSIIAGESLTTSLWTGDEWTGSGIWTSTTLWSQEIGQVLSVPIDPIDGVATDPVNDISFFGVTSDLTVSTDIYKDNPTTPYGILTSIHSIDLEYVSLNAGGDPFGVVTSVNIATVKASEQSGEIGTINKPYRLVGRYGTVGSVLEGTEYVHVRYKALPPRMYTLDTAFPLSTSWETPMINWIVGSALQDDNDASNNQRAVSFLTRYTRELEKEMKESSVDYSRSSDKYITKYTGGINNG